MLFRYKGYKILADLMYVDKSLKITEIKINFKKRIYGRSKMDLRVLYLFFSFFLKKIFKKFLFLN